MVIGEVNYLICKCNCSKNLSVLHLLQQISTPSKAQISYWLETTFFYSENAIKLNYSNAGRESGLVRSDLARGFSDLDITWLPYCAGAATGSTMLHV